MQEPDLARDITPSSAGILETTLNIFTSPTDAFKSLENKPTKIYPLFLVLILNAAVLLWYFNIVDYAWFVDDVLAAENLSSNELEEARDNMNSMSINTFAMFGVAGSIFSILAVYLLQSAYLSLIGAMRGDSYKFTHWFSLVCWSGLPFILSVIGMVVTILLNSNGQLSVYDLDPLSLRNLGINPSDSPSIQALARSINLPTLWSLALIVSGYKYWTNTGWLKAVMAVLAPYLLILGVWAYFSFS